MKKKSIPNQFALEILNAEPAPIKGMKHQFKHRKNFPLPKTQSRGKSLSRAHVVAQNKKRIAFEQKHCTPNQNYPLIHLELFKQRHIANNSIKEKWIVMRKLRLLALGMQQLIYSQLNSHEIQPLKKDTHAFYQLIEKREERHFQIDRTIKHLSDP